MNVEVFDDPTTLRRVPSIPAEVHDYVSPNLRAVSPDSAFPHMIVGDKATCKWPFFRPEIPHTWRVDRRAPYIGFVSRDEASILYNTALLFSGKEALEIGCWLGWSSCHLALGGVKLDVIDPVLARDDFRQSVTQSLHAAGVLNQVNLVGGASPAAVAELAQRAQKRWSLFFIDGNHDGDGPLQDAMICESRAAEDALVLFHDLNAPAVGFGLDYFKQLGWQTLVYQTMQIMGVAFRGNVVPIVHHPDPSVSWILPDHLRQHPVSR